MTTIQEELEMMLGEQAYVHCRYGAVYGRLEFAGRQPAKDPSTWSRQPEDT